MNLKKGLTLMLCLLMVVAFIPTTVIAKAAETTVTLSFDINGGEGEVPNSITVVNGEVVTLPSCSATKTGYEFIGWSTNENATTPMYASGDSYTLTADGSLYAVWQGVLKQYVVKHYVRNHIKVENYLYKTEYLQARVGEKTKAKPLTMVGYTVGSVTQRTVSATGTINISIFYSIKEYRSNDVNYDGEVDMLDAAMLQRCLAGWSGYDHNLICIYGADVNVDGKVNATDILTLLKILVGESPKVGKPDLEEDWGEWV